MAKTDLNIQKVCLLHPQFDLARVFIFQYKIYIKKIHVAKFKESSENNIIFLCRCHATLFLIVTKKIKNYLMNYYNYLN